MDELKRILEELQKAFAEFKKANDDRLKQLEAKGHADPLLTEKVERINKEIDRLDEIKTRLEAVETKAGRPQGIAGGETEDANKKAHREAFNGFIRRGNTTGLEDLEKKAMNVTTPADGGFAVPEEMDRNILNLGRASNIMRQICTILTMGTPDFKKLVNKHGATTGWVGEQEARPATDTPILAQLTPFWGEIYSNPQVSQTALDDLFFNVETFLAQELADDFSAGEEAAFISGDGNKKPKGFLAYDTSNEADAARALGKLQYVATGTAGAFKTTSASVNPADDLIDLIAALRTGHLAEARFLMNRLTAAYVRKFKDNNGAYIWQPSTQAGQPNLLLGYPVAIGDNMPDVANGSFPIAFGNFRRAYYIFDRIGSRMLRDPFTNKPFVGFYTTKRVGGMLADSEAIKLLKMAAS